MSQLLEECLMLKGQIAEIKCKLKLINQEILDKTPRHIIEEKIEKITNDFSKILAKIECLEQDEAK